MLRAKAALAFVGLFLLAVGVVWVLVSFILASLPRSPERPDLGFWRHSSGSVTVFVGKRAGCSVESITLYAGSMDDVNSRPIWQVDRVTDDCEPGFDGFTLGSPNPGFRTTLPLAEPIAEPTWIEVRGGCSVTNYPLPVDITAEVGSVTDVAGTVVDAHSFDRENREFETCDHSWFNLFDARALIPISIGAAALLTGIVLLIRDGSETKAGPASDSCEGASG